jgi:WD40 repeat protein
VALGTIHNYVRLWDVETGKEKSMQIAGHNAPVRAVAFSPDGRLLVTGGNNGQTRVWDAATHRELRALQNQSAERVSFSPDGRQLLISSSENDSITVWDTREWKTTLELLKGSEVDCDHASFTPDGKAIIAVTYKNSATDKNTLRIWDKTSGKQIKELKLDCCRPFSLSVSPDGKWTAVSGKMVGDDNYLRLCYLNGNRERVVEDSGTSFFEAAAFSPDGRLLATGNLDYISRLMEVSTGREVLTLVGHSRSVRAVAFLPNGRVLASADGETYERTREAGPQTIRFWDLGTGKEIERLEGHCSDVTSLAFSPNGKRFVAGLKNGTALVWETPASVLEPTKPVGRKLEPLELAALMKDLSGSDARTAYHAVWELAASPEQSVPLIVNMLKPAVKLDLAKVRQRIAELGDEDFSKRELASRELTQLGEDIEDELQKALANNPSPEALLRIKEILTAILKSPPPGRRRELRGVWVLELAGTPEAKVVLAGLAKGDPDAQLTREAKEAIERK